MAIQASIASTQSTVPPVTKTLDQGSLALTENSIVTLDVPPESISNYVKNGQDLLVQLKSGETVRIVNFYPVGEAPSQLFLVDKGKPVAVLLPPAAEDGVLAASYAPTESTAAFESLTAASTEGDSFASGGAALLAGAAVIGGAAAAIGNSSGSEDDAITGGLPGDVDEPDSDDNDYKISDDGKTISGTAKPGSTVEIDTNGDGKPDLILTADDNGNFSSPLNPPLTNGETVTVIVKDPDGTSSDPVQVTAPDTTPPESASNVQISEDGTTITGTAEPGATVEIDTNGDGKPDLTLTADDEGNFSSPLNPPLTSGETVSVIVKDPAGNSSEPVQVTAPDTSAPGEDNNIQISDDGAAISGTVKPGSTIEIDTDGDGKPDLILTADDEGNFSSPLSPPLTNGETVTVIVKDPDGTSNDPVQVTAPDTTPPESASNVQISEDGTTITGTAEPGATVEIDTNGDGKPDLTLTADDEGNFSSPLNPPLTSGETVSVIVKDPAGNSSEPVQVTAPDTSVPGEDNNVQISDDGSTISGTAKPGSKIEIDTDGDGKPDLTLTADDEGNFSSPLSPPLTNGETVTVIVKDPQGNSSDPITVTAPDTTAPDSPVIHPTNGKVVSGTAEPGSTVTLKDDDGKVLGETKTDDKGNWTITPDEPFADGTVIHAVATDGANNESQPVSITVDSAVIEIKVPEADDGWLNAEEVSNGIQIDVTLNSTHQAGDVITVKFAGPDGYEVSATHTLTAEDISAGQVTVDLSPNEGDAFPQGECSITANVNDGPSSAPVNTTVDTIAPEVPELTLIGNLLTISSEAGTELTVTMTIGGITHTTTVTANNDGIASLNLLNDFDVELSWDQILTATLEVKGADLAGNESPAASIGVGENVPQPLTIGNIGLDVSLNPLHPAFGVSGKTTPNSELSIQVNTPATNVTLDIIKADADGNFELNLLDPKTLEQLGLSVTDILNLGAELSFNMVATDPDGNKSAEYGISLSPDGMSLNIGQVTINGTPNDDILSGEEGSAEHINGNAGNDLILNVGEKDVVDGGEGRDTIEITDTKFTSVNGGDGFDTLILADGINLDYGSKGTGTLSSIERINLGAGGEKGSTLTLTAEGVLNLTDDNDTLQITGDAKDALNITGAESNGTQTIEGVIYDVYTFGNATLLVEENTVQVHV